MQGTPVILRVHEGGLSSAPIISFCILGSSDVVTALAGMEPEIEVRISIKAKEGQDYAAANEILERLKPSWKL
jgi:hypothetical protein